MYIYISGNDINNLINSVNDDIVIIDNWFISNRLPLNLYKSSFIIFHSSKKSTFFDFPLYYQCSSK